MRHYAWTNYRIQEAGKIMDALAGQYQRSYRATIGSFKKTIQGRKKWCMMVEEKTQNRESTNKKLSQEKAVANHS